MQADVPLGCSLTLWQITFHKKLQAQLGCCLGIASPELLLDTEAPIMTPDGNPDIFLSSTAAGGVAFKHVHM